MEILSVYDPLFKKYGSVVKGCDEQMKELTAFAKANCELPESGLRYRASIPELEALPAAEYFKNIAFGGLDVQFGIVWGFNSKLNCLEYHRDSEYNLSDEDFILLLAKREEIENDSIDSSCVKAFLVPANVMVEIYATTLHYAPCHADPEKGFRVVAVMSKGSNTGKPENVPEGHDSYLMFARNKWLMAHPDTFEAKGGAFTGITGKNIDLNEEGVYDK